MKAIKRLLSSSIRRCHPSKAGQLFNLSKIQPQGQFLGFQKTYHLAPGLGRFLPVDDEALLRKLLKSVRTDGRAPWPQYFVDVGIAAKTIGGASSQAPCPPDNGIRKMESDQPTRCSNDRVDDDAIVRLWDQLRLSQITLHRLARRLVQRTSFHSTTSLSSPTLPNWRPAWDGKRVGDCFTNPDTLLARRLIGECQGRVYGFLNM